ncbi:MAG: hypothetical protein H0U08_04745 [Actinobacteria bacterium]|nr:hypothetical protein [Actinomycetota bacterium]
MRLVTRRVLVSPERSTLAGWSARSRPFAGTRQEEAGLASGLMNTSQQIGGAVGIAFLSTIATSTTTDAVSSGTKLPIAMTDGFQAAFWAGATVALAGVLVSIFLVRGRDLQPQESSVGEPAFDAA